MKMMIAVLAPALALSVLPLQTVAGGTENSGRQTRGSLISAAMSGGLVLPGERAAFVHLIIAEYPPNPCNVAVPSPGPPDCEVVPDPGS